LGAAPPPGGRPRGGEDPDCNLIWLSPAWEVSLLYSLAEAGTITLFEAPERLWRPQER